MYQVKLGVFEGPFDLLLNLITKQKLDIYDIPISRITKEYLTYLRQMKDLNLEVTSEFILIALTLIEIKINSLLPKQEPETEDKSPQETRDLLISRLIEYKKFKDASIALTARSYDCGRIYSRDVRLEEKFTHLQPDFFQDILLTDIAKCYYDFITRKNQVISLSHISPINITVEMQIEKMMSLLKKFKKASFRRLTAECENKIEIIVSFLALLELLRNGIVYVDQNETFGNLQVQLLKDFLNSDSTSLP